MIIKKLKETLLGNSTKVETQTSLLEQKNIHYTNKELKDSENSVSTYVGVAAPVYLDDDPWFGPAPNRSEKQQDYMKQETEVKKQEEERKEELRASGHTVEDEDIHQKMYEIASKNWTTVSETQGGSENFHEGPGGWHSGNGYNQFRK